MIDFKLPSLGADMDQGKLLEWKVKPGDAVKRGQVVAIVDTSKAAVEVEIWHDGVVEALITQPGETIPVGTVMARTKRLEAEGVIKSYTAVLDHEKLGYGLTAVTEITVSKGKLVEMEKEIAKMPVACAVYDVTGLTDALIIAKFRSREELSDFTKALLAMPFVERTNTHVVLTTVKEDFRLPP